MFLKLVYLPTSFRKHSENDYLAHLQLKYKYSILFPYGNEEIFINRKFFKKYLPILMIKVTMINSNTKGCNLGSLIHKRSTGGKVFI